MIPRVGMGADVHPFKKGRELWLAGLLWTGEKGLAGHSDGDVACHAMCDALLSAAGMGDLGSQFGSDDPEMKGIKGVDLLKRTCALVRGNGYWIGNISVQIIGNSPRVVTRRNEAVARLTEAADCRVSISATTTDGLGLTGRGEGIAALATAIVFEPYQGAAGHTKVKIPNTSDKKAAKGKKKKRQ